MNIVEAVRMRKSIRGYNKEPVSKEVISKILNVATCAPSASNTQPWEFTVVAGKVLDNIRHGNIEKLTSGTPPNPDIPRDIVYQGIYKQRQVELAVKIFKLMGITRNDKVKRAEWMQRGFRFFDAPAAIIISIDKSLDETWTVFDIGAISQTICIVALNYGLGTCIDVQGVMFPEIIRKYTDIPESKRIVISIAIGYPDWDFPANKLKSDRESIENITTWYGFPD